MTAVAGVVSGSGLALAARSAAWSAAAARVAGGASVGVGCGSEGGSGMVRVASATGTSGAWATPVSSGRTPASSSRSSGSLLSSPWIASASGPALRGVRSGSVMTAVSVAMAEPLS